MVAGRSSAVERLRGRRQGLTRRRRARGIAPIIHADGDASRKYTVVEIIASDELGLLYRISRAIADRGCAIDLVLISTEGEKAIDVFHITKAGAKLAPSDQRALAQDLQHMLEENE